jgi:virginiamycin A acetyltransferase
MGEVYMGKIIRAILTVIFQVLAIPFYLYYRLEALVLGQDKAFQGASQFFSLFPGITGMYFRRAFYVMALKECSVECHIGFGTTFSHQSAELGKRVYIGNFCSIGDVTLGDFVTIGSNVDILNGGKQHGSCDINKPMQEQAGVYPRVTIGEDAWIGNSAVVMANVGKKAIIGAGSVVVKPVEDFSVVVGNPAVEIRKRV